MAETVVRFAVVDGDADDELLTAAERRRRDLLRAPADRKAYVAAHVLVRECAADLLGVPVGSVALGQVCPACGPGHGVPCVPGRPEVHLSLSHTRGHVAAMAARRPCGIDVEPPVPSLPERATTAAERGWLAGQPDRAVAAAQLWTRKESLVKAGLARLPEIGELAVATSTHLLPSVGTFALGGWESPGAVGAWAVTSDGHGDRAEPAR